jgi:hypothetical protein
MAKPEEDSSNAEPNVSLELRYFEGWRTQRNDVETRSGTLNISRLEEWLEMKVSCNIPTCSRIL